MPTSLDEYELTIEESCKDEPRNLLPFPSKHYRDRKPLTAEEIATILKDNYEQTT